MQNFSLTSTGILISIVGTVLVHFGFSEQCSSELTAIAPVLLGGIVAQIGRFRAGGINALGVKNGG